MKRLLLMAMAATLLYLGCKEKDPVTPDRGRSYVHFLGGLEADTFDVILDYYNADDIVINTFHQNRNFPMRGYADLEAAGVADEFGNGKLYVTLSRQPFANIAPDTIMDTKETILERDKRTTVAFVDSFGTSTFIQFEDILPGGADGSNGMVRFMNLYSATPTAALTATDNSVTISGVNFMTASSFVAVPAGFHTFELRDAGGNVVHTAYLNVSPYSTQTIYVSGSTGPNMNLYYH